MNGKDKEEERGEVREQWLLGRKLLEPPIRQVRGRDKERKTSERRKSWKKNMGMRVPRGVERYYSNIELKRR